MKTIQTKWNVPIPFLSGFQAEGRRSKERALLNSYVKHRIIAKSMVFYMVLAIIRRFSLKRNVLVERLDIGLRSKV